MRILSRLICHNILIRCRLSALYPSSNMIHLIAVAGYVHTHILGIALAIVTNYAIGFLWYGPLFGKPWMKLNGITPPKPEEMKFSMMLPGLTASLFASFAQAAVLGRTFEIVALANMSQAVLIAVIIWLPFTALSTVNSYAWGGKPVRLMFIDTFYTLASMCAMAAILYATL